MTNLPEASGWVAGIYQIEQTDPVLGGPPNLETGAGIANVQAQQLAERTVWLKAEIAAAVATVIATGTGLNGGGAFDGGLTLSADLAGQTVAEAGSNNLQLMTALRTKQAIDVAINALVGAAPAQLDTLNELAEAITSNGDTSAALTALIAAKLDAANYTAADIMAKLKTVDGNGSGLDADRLDGLSSSSFARSTRTISAGAGLTGGGTLASNRTISASIPTQNEAVAGTIQTKLMTPLRTKQAITAAIDALVNGAPAALDTLKELADELSDNDNAIAALTSLIGTKLNASSYTAADILAKLLTVDGAGSGLDADKLDGLSSASFARSARTISTGTGLTGGGALTANRTISVDFAEKGDAETGTNSSEVMSPLRTHQAIKAVQSNALPTAWVNFNGQGTVVIREACNVSSITDLGAGHYRANFASPMANAKYAVLGLHGNVSTAGDERNNFYLVDKSTTYVEFYTTNVHGTAGDWDNVSILIMGGL
ncbi:hypothetical protein FEE96_06970 [Parasedimentitalea maritima]|uniref:Uncharacterized protein n=1 Tax=Parasedimentitalea maritima TaxID=2578117 RepID=A0ABY2UX93_9RHOB|nr:hypothetical protein [Zongyanglinia marina]TLP67082.1 hypothetical protein FEE96_06970 [Zongyanglinia marina]